VKLDDDATMGAVPSPRSEAGAGAAMADGVADVSGSESRVSKPQLDRGLVEGVALWPKRGAVKKEAMADRVRGPSGYVVGMMGNKKSCLLWLSEVVECASVVVLTKLQRKSGLYFFKAGARALLLWWGPTARVR
jgi:hypothetical protein